MMKTLCAGSLALMFSGCGNIDIKDAESNAELVSSLSSGSPERICPTFDIKMYTENNKVVGFWATNDYTFQRGDDVYVGIGFAAIAWCAGVNSSKSVKLWCLDVRNPLAICYKDIRNLNCPDAVWVNMVTNQEDGAAWATSCNAILYPQTGLVSIH